MHAILRNLGFILKMRGGAGREREALFLCFRRSFPPAVVEEGWKRKSQREETPARNHGFV